MEVKHVLFNPYSTGLDHICRREEQDGWRLDRIVPHYQYESIAVFVRKELNKDG